MPWSLLTLLLVLLAVGVALVGAICLIMAKVLLTPARMTDGRALFVLRRLSPEDLGLAFEECSFLVHDQRTAEKLKIAAWWIPATAAPSTRLVVIVHGYSDAKVGSIAWAPTFVAMGYNVLAVDLRAHGESEGTHTTAGYFERHDVSAVIDQIRARRPAETAEVVLFGVSLGAAVAGGVAAMRDDIAALIMDSPYSDYVSAAQTHARSNGLPGPLFQRLAIDWAQRLSGADFLACSPAALIPGLACPLMVISAADDLFVDPADMDRVEAAVRARPPELAPTAYWRVAQTHHVLAIRTDPAEFRRRIEAFLDAAIEWRGQLVKMGREN